jgi:predicted TIM-barrel fold metal-dependent hydrolase
VARAVAHRSYSDWRESVTLLIFDAHVHVWPADRTRYPPLDLPGSPLPPFDGSVERLLALMDGESVERALLVQTPWYGEDNRYLIESMRAYPDRFIGMGHLPDPCDTAAPDKLSAQTENGMRGVRLHLLQPPAIAAAHEGRLDPLLDRARELAVPVQLLYRDPAIHRLVGALAARHPDLDLVVDHLGHAGPDADAGWEDLLALGRRQGVYLKVSLHYRLSREPFPHLDLHPLQRRVVAAFTPRRLMWGSNFPMHLEDADYARRLAVVSEHLPFLSGDDREWILWRTASSLWPASGGRDTAFAEARGGSASAATRTSAR